MVDREKVIKNLEELLVFSRYNDSVEWNPYNDTETLEDAIALLKEQEARVMKVGEVRSWVNSDRVTREPVFIEMRSGVCAWIIDDEVREISGAENLTSDLYGKTWRCWTSRPTDELKETVKWDGDT